MPRQRRGSRLPRFYSGFPDGWQGLALLLQRAVLGSALLVQGGFYLHTPDATDATWFVGLIGLATGSFLLIGLLTPVVISLVGFVGIGVWLSVLPCCKSTLLDSGSAVTFSITMLMVTIILGPGAFSADAKLFGRREIIIPPASSRLNR